MIIIVGGGLVGASLAYLLAEQNLQVLLIEAKLVDSVFSESDYRSLVLSYSSQQIFNAMGLWSKMAEFASFINEIHVSDRGHFGACRFVAQKLGLPTLGCVIPIRVLTQVLHQSVRRHKNIEFLNPAQVIRVDQIDKKLKLTIQQEENIEIRIGDLVIAADGADSKLREHYKISAHIKDYQQTAIVTTVELAQEQQHVAYERFTESGLLALLPLAVKQSAVIWTVATAEAQALLALSDEDFLAQLQKCFGYRLGKFVKVTQRGSHPLRQVIAEKQVLPGIVFIGNAAHALHPVAGQGFNLALRDVAALAQILHESKINGLGDEELLKKYETWRDADQKRINHFTDGMVSLFNNPHLPARLMRKMGLLAVDASPFLQRQIVKRILGLSGRVPQLLCGLPLETS